MAAAFEAGGTVKLANDLTLTSQISTDETVTLNLDGHTISSEISSPLFYVEDGTLTLTGNGTINTTNIAAKSANDGVIIVSNGTYSSSAKEPFVAGENGTVTINGGQITGSEGAVIATDGSGIIIINDGTLIGLDGCAVCTNGAEGMGYNTITISGGHLEGNIQSSGYEAVGVYIANNDVFVMNGGEIVANGGTGICMRGGDVTINRGLIQATNVDKNGDTVSDGKIGTSNTVMTGCSAIVFDEAANFPGNTGMKLTIEGGTITGVDHSIQVLSEAETPAVYVTGGTLTPEWPEEVSAGN